MKGNSKVLYLVSHGHTARGLIQTGLFEKLHTRGNELTVLSKDSDDRLEKTLGEKGISTIQYKPPASRFQIQKEVFRAYVNQDIRRNPALYEKYKRKSSRPSKWKRRVFNKVFFTLANTIRRVPVLKKAYSNWERKSYTDEVAISLLEELMPDLIVSTRPSDPMESHMVGAAKKIGIKVLYYILSWDNITSKGFFPFSADAYVSWGPVMSKELEEYYGVPKEKVTEAGVSHFDLHYVTNRDQENEKILLKFGLNPDKPFIFFTMSAAYFNPSEMEIIEKLKEQLENDRFGKDMQLVVRPHMQNLKGQTADTSWIPRLERLPSNRVGLDLPNMSDSQLTWSSDQNDMKDYSRLLASCSLCLNTGSTIAIEACLLDKPVIITSFDLDPHEKWFKSATRLNEYLHLKTFYSFGGVELAESFGHLLDLINENISKPEKNRIQRERATKEECFAFDGASTQRVAKGILENIENGV